MSSMLDERPARRSTPLFGRALIAQQQAEQKAQEDAVKDQRDQMRDRETRRHNVEMENLDRLRAETAMAREQAAALAESHKLQMQKAQAEAFVGAQEEIGKLKPNQPDLSEKIAAIQGKYNILFDGQGTTFGQHLGTQVADLFKRRDAIQSANTAIAEKYPGTAPIVNPTTGVLDASAMSKAHAEQQSKAMTDSGLVPKSGKDPLTGIEYGQPPKDTSVLTAHDKADLAWKSYQEATRLRAKSGLKDPDVIKVLDSQRTAAMQQLSSLGIKVDSNSALANEHPVQPSAPAVPAGNANAVSDGSALPPSADNPVASSGELQDQPKLQSITPDLYLSAQSAITSGKDPSAVKQRLIESGYDPAGLDNGPGDTVR